LIPYLESSSQAEDALDRSGEQLLIDMEEQIAQNAQLNSAMKKLTENQREIIYLRFYSKLDYKEIAEITNLKYQSVRNTMYRAIKVLRAAFNVKK
ncbi:MAG: RNA polymerase sigma factor, partial [Chitinophagales bacterium]